MADLQNTSFKKEIIEISSNYTAQNDDDNALIIMNGDIDVTIPSGLDKGWHAIFVANDTDVKDFVEGTGVTIKEKGNNGITGFNTVHAHFRFTHAGNDDHYLDTNAL